VGDSRVGMPVVRPEVGGDDDGEVEPDVGQFRQRVTATAGL
jgi:hypothetical protein